ncbi:MAG TPA: acyl-phosphate glycerol 3-phosphate acyltransferase [Erysipelotrichaceae bacterium]|nr:acyl-phosphate glycerol 3-phosphate acyltransferase [Erysipelotrichaceae bacterium]
MIDPKLILAIVFGYLFGSIPFALIIGKVFYKTDIRTKGSGNLGGTNAGRVLGKTAGISVTVFDVLKATIAILIVYQFAPQYAAIAGVFAAIGHSYPIFAQFKGGKAVSTAAGYLLGAAIIVNQVILLFIVPASLFFIILKLTKYASLASMVAATISIFIAYFATDGDWIFTLNFILIDILIFYRHRANIKRLLNGTETKVTWI